MNPSIYSQAAANGTSRRFALIDARHVEDTYLLKRCGGTPALRCPDPILEPAQAYGTVLRETNGAWRMYYLHGRFKKDPSRPQDNLGYIMRLALSNDGISWSKPDLGPEGADEFGDNNVIMGKHYVDARGQDLTGNTGPEGFCILDAEQQTLPHVRGRYTCLFLAGPSDRYGGLCLAHSDNGIRWHGYPENPLIPGWHDTSACMFYDPRIERYVLYTRPPTFAGPHGANRKIARLESADLLDWSIPRVVLDTDEIDAPAETPTPIEKQLRGPDRQWYGMTAFPWENLTIGLGWMYDVVPGNMSIELLHSYDGIDWRREGPRRPWVADDCPSGLSSHMYVTASNPPHVLDKEMWFYVSGANRNHHQVSSATPSQMRLLSMPLNRWVSYGTHGEHPGLLLSAPLAWRGGRLALNAAIDPDGYIKTSICDLRGNELPDYDLDKINLLQGPVDEVEQPVRYWGDLDKRYFSLPDQGPVRLKFTLYKARLYGWTLL